MKTTSPSKAILSAAVLAALLGSTQAAVILTGVSYNETFDGIASGLPSGFDTRVSASASSLGTASAFTTTKTVWGASSFANMASSEGLASNANTTAQSGSTDRVIGLKQSGGTQDPGAAFTIQIGDTLGFENIALSLKLQDLNNGAKTTTWTVRAALGSAPTSFTSLGTIAPSAFGSTSFSANLSTALGSGINNQSQNLWIQVVALSASTGSGQVDVTGLDDFGLTYSAVAVPEPQTYAMLTGVALVGFGFWRRSRR